MSQDLFDQQDVTKVECPVCGVATWEGAPTCLSCGTTLRPASSAPADDLWSVDDDSLFEDVADAELVDDNGLWDDVDEPAAGPAPAGAFGTGAAGTPLFAAPAPDAAVSEDELWEPAGDVEDRNPAPPPDASDPHGLGAAVGHLDPGAVEHAVVPLAVCSVLLEDDEVVAAALIGNMLGQPAAMVLTGRRVLVANGRRWRPVVDSFPLAPGLGVRGRHDGGVAAVTLLDDERLVTVDGVGDVAAATRFADMVRSRSGA